MRLYDVTDALG